MASEFSEKTCPPGSPVIVATSQSYAGVAKARGYSHQLLAMSRSTTRQLHTAVAGSAETLP